MCAFTHGYDGVEVLRPDLTRSAATADLELLPGATPGATGLASCLADHPERTAFVAGTPDPTPAHRRDASYAVRLGLDSVRGIGTAVAERIVAARAERPFADQLDLSGLDIPIDDVAAALAVDVDEWQAEIPYIEQWLDKIGEPLPTVLHDELAALKHRL